MHEEVYRQGHRVELQEGPLALLVLEARVWELQLQTSRPSLQHVDCEYP